MGLTRKSSLLPSERSLLLLSVNSEASPSAKLPLSARSWLLRRLSSPPLSLPRKLSEQDSTSSPPAPSPELNLSSPARRSSPLDSESLVPFSKEDMSDHL